MFFSAITPDQHVREATEWFIRKLGIKEAGPLKFSHSPSSGLTGNVITEAASLYGSHVYWAGTTKFMEETEEVHSSVANRAPLPESHLFL